MNSDNKSQDGGFNGNATFDCEGRTPTKPDTSQPELNGQLDNTELMTLLMKQTQLMTRLQHSPPNALAQTLQTYQVMPDLTKGEKYGASAKEWLQSINGSGALHRWSEEVKLETARMNLRGAAKAWHEARDSQHGKRAFITTAPVSQLKSYANHEESDDSLSDNKEDEEYDSDTFTEETADADKLRPTRICRKPNKYKDFYMSITSGYKYELDTEDDLGHQERCGRGEPDRGSSRRTTSVK
ncbi:hypothetical protein RN001_004498 [Aquatica leii]|uniref:Uncharacterized protein n=1 Tax=Aquatica leii TaxID=1421715 RepID=A0AAN7PYL7_9COLE|nr:hypothetical protein RN001_004498 [Aquatica leii]